MVLRATLALATAVIINAVLFVGLAILNLPVEVEASREVEVRIARIPRPDVPIEAVAAAPIEPLDEEIPTVTLDEPTYAVDVEPVEIEPVPLAADRIEFPVIGDGSRRADRPTPAPERREVSDVATSASSVDRKLRPLSTNPRPDYPRAARHRRLEGRVTLELIVDRTGAVESFRVLDVAGGDAFRRAVVAVVPRWRFEPAVLDGEPVKVRLIQPVRFELEER